MNRMAEYKPITDLPDDWPSLASEELADYRRIWAEQGQQIEATEAYGAFMERLVRQVSIETGVIERLYTLDRGITLLLIERGIDEALIPHGSTGGRHPDEVAAMIQDHQRAVEGLFQFVKGQRRLSLSYIRELHQVLTANQRYVFAKDQFGNNRYVDLIRGYWKKCPNNPTRLDGTVHAYCPPEQVPPQMEQLIAWYHRHIDLGVPPEVEAAWLHHRFTQIHPFQDGNGRVARMLASLVFIRDGGFPLAITSDDRGSYLDALEAADRGDLAPLVDLFSLVEIESYQQALNVVREVLELEPKIDGLIAEAASGVEAKRSRVDDAIQLELKQRVSELMDYTEEKSQEIRKKIVNSSEAIQVYIHRSDWNRSRRHFYAVHLATRLRTSGYLIDQDLDFKDAQIRVEISDGLSIQQIVVAYLLTVHNNVRGVIVGASYEFQEKDTTISESISDKPFTFAHDDRFATVRIEYQRWLNGVIEAGLEKWREQAGGQSQP